MSQPPVHACSHGCAACARAGAPTGPAAAAPAPPDPTPALEAALDDSYAALRSMDKSVTGPGGVTRINVDAVARVPRWPDAARLLSRYANATRLELVNLYLERFPEDALTLARLDAISLKGNELRTLPASFGAAFPRLTSLDLEACRLASDETLFPALTALAGTLVTLNVPYNELEKLRVPSMQRLEALNVAGNRRLVWIALQPPKELPAITMLDITACAALVGETGRGLEGTLESFAGRSLKALRLAGLGLRDADLASLRLDELFVGLFRKTDQKSGALLGIDEAPSSTLLSLDLRANPLTAASLDALARLTRLEELDLRDTDVGDFATTLAAWTLPRDFMRAGGVLRMTGPDDAELPAAWRSRRDDAPMPRVSLRPAQWATPVIEPLRDGSYPVEQDVRGQLTEASRAAVRAAGAAARLFLGSHEASMNAPFLRGALPKEYGEGAAHAPITHVLAIGAENTPMRAVDMPQLVYRVERVPDSANADIKPLLAPCADFIRDALAASPAHAVLVHCKQGSSRSAAVVAAYLVRERGMQPDGAIALLALLRAETRDAINASFRRQLEEWARELPPQPAQRPGCVVA